RGHLSPRPIRSRTSFRCQTFISTVSMTPLCGMYPVVPVVVVPSFGPSGGCSAATWGPLLGRTSFGRLCLCWRRRHLRGRDAQRRRDPKYVDVEQGRVPALVAHERNAWVVATTRKHQTSAYPRGRGEMNQHPAHAPPVCSAHRADATI